MPSKVENFFKKGVGVGICNQCGSSLTTKHGNTSSLRSHLQLKHAKTDYIALLAMETDEGERAADNEPMTKKPKQPTLAESIAQSSTAKWDDKSDESIRIDKIIIRWCVQDYLPFKFVDGDGFKEFMNAICLNYRIKGRNYYAKKMPDNLYDNNKLHI
jgi:hypothetical protein